MPHDSVLSPSEQNLNNKSPKSGNSLNKNFSFTIFFATAALCLLSSNQAVSATDINTQVAANEDNHFNECQHNHKSSGLLPRILSLIASPFKSQSSERFQTEPYLEKPQNISDVDAVGGSFYRDMTPIYLSQAKSSSAGEFLASTKIKPIPSARSAIALSKAETRIYTVKTGDTIARIAKNYNVSRKEIIALNKIKNSNIIFVNQKLRIPATKLEQVGSEKITFTPTDLPQNAKQNSQDRYKLNTSTNSSAAILDEERLANLRADIERMRAEYQNKNRKKRVENKIISSDSNLDRNKDNSSTNKLLQTSVEKVDVATSVETKTSANSDSILEEAVSLQLPPLPSSEQYLPEAFDGYSWPAQGVLSSGYGWRWGRLHKGIDIAAPVGTPVFAAAAGEVVSAGWNSGGYGNLIKLQHLDGSITVYAHNNRILVSNGQKVRQGEQIAEMGNTGFSTGSHLHFEIHARNRGVVNPLALLN